jgi:peptide deformylase
MQHPILNIRIYPDPILKKKAQSISKITDQHRRLVSAMIETMYAAPGVGLAAPQVGISQRLIVIHIPTEDEKEKRNPLTLINPRIIQKEGEILGNEGCLSLPEVSVDIKRSSYIKVVYEDPRGKEKRIEGTDLLARIIQHEIDHLNGILLVDYMGRIKRDLIKRKFRKKPPPPPPITQDPEFLQALKISLVSG